MSRLFELVRARDVSGVSGTGVVAEGVEYTDGTVALRWKGKHPATAVWPNLAEVLAVHGHDGDTVVRWVSSNTPESYLARIIAGEEAGLYLSTFGRARGGVYELFIAGPDHWRQWVEYLGGSPDAAHLTPRESTTYPWQWNWLTPDGTVNVHFITDDPAVLGLSEGVAGDAHTH